MGHREATARMDVVEEKFAEDLLGDGARRDKRRYLAYELNRHPIAESPRP